MQSPKIKHVCHVVKNHYDFHSSDFVLSGESAKMHLGLSKKPLNTIVIDIKKEVFEKLLKAYPKLKVNSENQLILHNNLIARIKKHNKSDIIWHNGLQVFYSSRTVKNKDTEESSVS